MKKKFASLLAAGIMTAAMNTMTVCAAAPAAEDLPLCAVENCAVTECHEHDGTLYAGHHAEDGHTYHTACDVSGCTVIGSHTTHHTGYTYIGGHHGGHHGRRSSGHCH